ncbi:putative restriction-modification system control element Bcll [Peptoniphilus sp. DNF00840]|nr:putative restriction-modification system control element Bcll [Peptoniphilus sp. DNF00840]
MAIYLLEEFGERVKDLRKNRGLSQEKLALKINMDRTYLASVEAGNRNISLRNIEKIANGFEMSISELFEGVENEKR